MARGTNRTTMAKIDRERRLQQRRADKLARKERRRDEKLHPEWFSETRAPDVDVDVEEDGDSGDPSSGAEETAAAPES